MTKTIYFKLLLCILSSHFQRWNSRQKFIKSTLVQNQEEKKKSFREKTLQASKNLSLMSSCYFGWIAMNFFVGQTLSDKRNRTCSTKPSNCRQLLYHLLFWLSPLPTPTPKKKLYNLFHFFIFYSLCITSHSWQKKSFIKLQGSI